MARAPAAILDPRIRLTGTTGPRTTRSSTLRSPKMSQQSCADMDSRTWSSRRRNPTAPATRFEPTSRSGRLQCGSSTTSSWPRCVANDANSEDYRVGFSSTEWARRNVLDVEIEPAKDELDTDQNWKRSEHHRARRCRNARQCRVKPLADAEQRAAAHEREAEHELQGPGIEIAQEVRVKKSLQSCRKILAGECKHNMTHREVALLVAVARPHGNIPHDRANRVEPAQPVRFEEIVTAQPGQWQASERRAMDCRVSVGRVHDVPVATRHLVDERQQRVAEQTWPRHSL